jgi:hypothetical protein
MLPTTLFLPTAAIIARVTCGDFSRVQQTSVFSTTDGASNVLTAVVVVVGDQDPGPRLRLRCSH